MLKNRFTLLLLPAVLLSTSVFATTSTAPGFNGPSKQMQGFQGPTHSIDTVKSVLNAGVFSNDKPVTLTGNIVNSLGGEHYTFTDGTGSITIEIDNDKWLGLQITPQTKITLYGDIDKRRNRVMIDVDSIRVAN
jgi:uncharacterized protein (TIGR00156 family)